MSFTAVYSLRVAIPTPSLLVAVPTLQGKTEGRERLRSLPPVFPWGLDTATHRLSSVRSYSFTIINN